MVQKSVCQKIDHTHIYMPILPSITLQEQVGKDFLAVEGAVGIHCHKVLCDSSVKPMPMLNYLLTDVVL